MDKETEKEILDGMNGYLERVKQISIMWVVLFVGGAVVCAGAYTVYWVAFWLGLPQFASTLLGVFFLATLIAALMPVPDYSALEPPRWEDDEE